MTINIEKMRAEMQSDLAKQQQYLKWETRKFVVQALAASAALMAAGAALATLVLHLTGKI